MPEWDKFKIHGDLETQAAELKIVRHIVHAPVARRIIEDANIKSGLVYDESRMNQTRVSVTWLSANTWNDGSIYGTVEFKFDWKSLVDGKNIYWVEAIETYNPAAYRFLLTSDKIQSGLVQLYDPIKDNGPLRRVRDRWFWNSNFTSEFMIAQDLALDRATGLGFVAHHPRICNSYGAANCDDIKQPPSIQRTGGRILGYVLGHDLSIIDKHLRPTKDDPALRFDDFDTAFSGLYRDLLRNVKFAGTINNPGSRRAVVKGALALFGMDQKTSAQDLISLLASGDTLKETLTEIVRQHFATPGWMPED